MKFRNRFLKYARPQFSNDVINLTQYAPQAFCFADGDGDNTPAGNTPAGNTPAGNPPADNTPADKTNNTSGIAMTDAQFDRWIATQGKSPADKGDNKSNADNRNESAYDRIKAEEQAKVDANSNENAIRDTVKFEMSFDKFIKDNANSFDTDVDKFRQGAKGLEGKALQSSLSCTAAKSFFSKSDNLGLLPEHEQQYIKNKIIGIADNAVDSAKAWQLLCDAIHIKSRINQSSDFKKNGQAGGHGDDTNTPNVTAYIDKCMARGKSKAA